MRKSSSPRRSCTMWASRWRRKGTYSSGKTQEEYGPPVAEELLDSIGFPSDRTEIVMNIIGNHHSPSRYDYPELGVLKEADRFVNRAEDA